MTGARDLVLKIDVDTHDGMRRGVPALLEILRRHRVPASFCLSFGPDNSGKAIFRLLRDPAFLRKMWRTRAPRLYGWRTIVSGTLLPARNIATAFPELVRQIAGEGHEIIVHAWDHRRWQDHLGKMGIGQIRGEFDRAFAAFERILGRRPSAVAAPAWQVTHTSLTVQEQLQLRYASDLRNGPPCTLVVGQDHFHTLQIASTGPCVEELLTVGMHHEAELIEALLTPLREAVQPVLALHAEVEGGPFSAFFDRLLPRLLQQHPEIIPMENAANRILANTRAIPRRELHGIALPGRPGLVASSQELLPAMTRTEALRGLPSGHSA